MLSDKRTKEFFKNAENSLKQISEYCSEDEMNDLKEQIMECLEDDFSTKSLLFVLEGLSKTPAITKASKCGVPVSELFNNLVIYDGSYNINKKANHKKEIFEDYNDTYDDFNEELNGEQMLDDDFTIDNAIRR